MGFNSGFKGLSGQTFLVPPRVAGSIMQAKTSTVAQDSPCVYRNFETVCSNGYIGIAQSLGVSYF